jgi:hypothetical protein
VATNFGDFQNEVYAVEEVINSRELLPG